MSGEERGMGVSPPVAARNAAIVLGVPSLAIGADYLGWIKGDITFLLYAGIALGALSVWGVGALENRRPFLATTLLALVSTAAMTLLNNEAGRIEETARWRIVLMEACATADRTTEFAGLCREARVRADYEPCDYGTTAEQCRRELYRDTGWTLIETPIPPHEYGDLLPAEETPR